MNGSTKLVTRAAALVGVFALLVAGAQASGAKTAPKGKRTSGSTYVGTTHTVGSKTYAAGAGIDKLLGPGAITLVFISTTPTSQPGVVKATANPMVLWLRHGTMSGSGTVLVNTVTGRLTNGHAHFKGRTGAYKGHTLDASFSGTADLAKGQYYYTYTGIYK